MVGYPIRMTGFFYFSDKEEKFFEKF